MVVFWNSEVGISVPNSREHGGKVFTLPIATDDEITKRAQKEVTRGDQQPGKIRESRKLIGPFSTQVKLFEMGDADWSVFL